MEFIYNNGYYSRIRMNNFQALYGRTYCSPSCLLESGDRALLGLDMVRDTTERVEEIKKRMKEAWDRQKSCVDDKRRHVEFGIGDIMYIKISPIRGDSV